MFNLLKINNDKKWSIMSRVLLFSILLSFCLFGESPSLNWGKEQGSLDWKSAIEKCKVAGMRLPTKKELLSLYKSREFKKWEANWYWTNDESDTERAWAVVLNVGAILHIPKQYHNNVRCIN